MGCQFVMMAALENTGTGTYPLGRHDVDDDDDNDDDDDGKSG